MRAAEGKKRGGGRVSSSSAREIVWRAVVVTESTISKVVVEHVCHDPRKLALVEDEGGGVGGGGGGGKGCGRSKKNAGGKEKNREREERRESRGRSQLEDRRKNASGKERNREREEGRESRGRSQLEDRRKEEASQDAKRDRDDRCHEEEYKLHDELWNVPLEREMKDRIRRKEEAEERLFKLWKFRKKALLMNLEKRRVGDMDVLPYYPYRDVLMLV
eukprot:TRINITY_DN685_c0_g1_i3.p1 TRINITY_DN685_c0_g1~~TRINITY_DN685_c0_g1_i3.p1  ORF type:complete len:218 (-),score=58.70 TRINITY_DN685_c0_g1_i3:618-1271(-)